MLQQPGLETEDCPNRDVCGTIVYLSEEERVELAIGREREREVSIEYVRMRQRDAAHILLMQRGNPQTPESLGIEAIIANIDSSLDLLCNKLEQFQSAYVAPPECEAHRYNVKRPSGVFWYNKLTAKERIFDPSIAGGKVKVIHLSHDDDYRNRTAREGIERRNKLLAAVTKLKRAENEIKEALEALA
jgi:hypothetical protein